MEAVLFYPNFLLLLTRLFSLRFNYTRFLLGGFYMLKFAGILLIIIGLCLIIYGLIPPISGYHLSSYGFCIGGAICVGGGAATVKFAKEKN